MISRGDMALRQVQNTERDMKLLLKWLSDPRVLRWAYGEDAPWDIEKISEHFSPKASDSTARCFIVHGTAEIGYIQYFPVEEDSYKYTSREMFEAAKKGYGIDIFIGEVELWDKGIGGRAVALIEEYLRGNTSAELICADPATDNPRAQRFWRKAGFTPIGLIENYDDPAKQSTFMIKQISG
ncbi:MAG: GNAT family N-acetyltransferase [Oscillospiraceae bacterium]|nr:GNAT family N-acetyltransferase [Oscillospiraceae bacterium]